MRRPSLLVIFLTVFIDLIGFGIVLPLLPRYSEKFGAGGLMIGLIMASFSAMQFLLSPAWGRWSDRVGRRPVLLISNFGSVVSYGLFALAGLPSLSPGTAVLVLLSSRVFAGACGANLSVASAYIADITPPEKRSKSMALIGVAFGLGFILGPALGAFSAHFFGLAGPGCVASGLCALNFVLACFILAESRKPEVHAVERPKLAQWGHILRQPKVGLLVGLYALSTFAFVCYECTLPLLLGSPSLHPDDITAPRRLAAKLTDPNEPVSAALRGRFSPKFIEEIERPDASEFVLRRHIYRELNRLVKQPGLFEPAVLESLTGQRVIANQVAASSSPDACRRLNRLVLEDAFPSEIARQRVYYDEQRIGYVFAYCGLISVLIQGGVIGRLVKRFGERRVIFGSLVVIAGSLAALPYAGSLAGLLLALGVFSAGAGVNRAPTMGLLSLCADPKEQGATMGVAQSAGTLARVVGPMIASPLFKASPHSPYFLAAAVAALGAAIAWRYLLSDTARGKTEPEAPKPR